MQDTEHRTSSCLMERAESMSELAENGKGPAGRTGCVWRGTVNSGQAPSLVAVPWVCLLSNGVIPLERDFSDLWSNPF